jgi:hypothetical protein
VVAYVIVAVVTDVCNMFFKFAIFDIKFSRFAVLKCNERDKHKYRVEPLGRLDDGAFAVKL